ncbi:hypothetical protein M9458_001478, partial [Cirrhinus mrigala]
SSCLLISSCWLGWELQPSPPCLSSCISTSGTPVRTPHWWKVPAFALTCVSM